MVPAFSSLALSQGPSAEGVTQQMLSGGGTGGSLLGGGATTLQGEGGSFQDFLKGLERYQKKLPKMERKSNPAPPAPSMGGGAPPPSTFKGFGAWRGGERGGGSSELIEALLSLLQGERRN